jgi:hypothetical protein
VPRPAVVPLLIALIVAVPGGVAAPSSRAAPAAAAAASYTKVAGVTLASGSNQIQNTELPRINQTGINAVSINIWWQIDSSQTTLSPSSNTPADADLGLTLDQIRARGMRPVLEPMFVCQSCAINWRGAVQPSNRDAFYASYRDFINHYAAIAQQHGVWLFFIGSEMNSTQVDTAQWQEVAAEVRQRYSGTIAYEANFDDITNVGFWSSVDVAGVSAYCPLTDAASPSLAELLADWRSSQAARTAGHNWVAEIANLASTSGKPVIFGEVGYRSTAYAAKAPFDYGTNNPYDGDVQANAYQALLETFDDQPWWMGAIWWEWHINQTSPDTTYTPRAKPAEDLMTRWYAQGWRPGRPGAPGSTTAGRAVGHPTPASVSSVQQARGTSATAAAHPEPTSPGTVAPGTAAPDPVAPPVSQPTGSSRVLLKADNNSRALEVGIAVAALFGALVGFAGVGVRRLRTMPLPGS